MDASDGIAELAQIPERASASACFGQATTQGERTIIPVAEITYGVGFGWGRGASSADDSEGGGGAGGGGSRVRGVAVVELSADGVVIHAIRDETAITLANISFAAAATAIVSRTLQKLLRG